MIGNLIVIFLILLIGIFYSTGIKGSRNSDSNRKQYIFVICLILILQSGLRNVAVGADTYAYSVFFQDVKNMSWTDVWLEVTNYYQLAIGKDPGYVVFEKLAQYIAPTYQLFLMLISILFFAAMGNFIYKNTTELIEVIFAFILYSALYYSFFSITGHRQTIATAAVFVGFELIKKRKAISFLIIILLASTIHRSSLVFLPFYFIGQIQNTKLFYTFVLLLFPFLLGISSQMSVYLQLLGGYEGYDSYDGAGTYTFTSLIILVALTTWWRLKSVLYKNPDAGILYNAFALAILFTPLTWFNPSAMRVVQYFSIFMMVLIPLTIQSFTRFSAQIKFILFQILIFILIGLFMKSNWNSSYKFFWQDMPLGDNYLDSNF